MPLFDIEKIIEKERSAEEEASTRIYDLLAKRDEFEAKCAAEGLTPEQAAKVDEALVEAASKLVSYGTMLDAVAWGFSLTRGLDGDDGLEKYFKGLCRNLGATDKKTGGED